MNQDQFSSRVLRELCRFAFYFAVAAAFSGYYQKWHFAEADMPGEHSRASTEAMVDGTAYRPHVYRQMLPVLANLVDDAVPPAVKHRIYTSEIANGDPFLYAISVSPTVQSQRYTLRYLALYLLTFLSALAAMYGMFLVCRELGVSEPGTNGAPVVLMIVFPYLMSVGGFFYDFPELALMVLAVFMVLRSNWWWAIPIVVLGEWNKGSFLFFVFTLYPFLRRRISAAGSWLGVGVLCAAAAGIYLPLRAHFAHNPGGTVEVWWLEQLKYPIHPGSFLFAWEETYGIPAPKIYALLPMALLIAVVRRSWRCLSLLLRRHAGIAAAINLPLYFVFGFPGELRDLSMLYVTFLVMLACLINEWTGANPACAARNRPLPSGC